MSVLVAGLGNIFNGDDAFGAEVARRLSQRPLPEGATVVDFGIRGIDPTTRCSTAIGRPCSWTPRNAERRRVPPRSSSRMQRSKERLSRKTRRLSPHELDPAKVLRLVAALGGKCKRVLLVVCEPLALGGEAGVMELNKPVREAVEAAVSTVEGLIVELMEDADELVRSRPNPN